MITHDLTALGLPLVHPVTGRAFTRCDHERHQDRQLVRWGPPSYPSSGIWDYSGDDAYFVRDMTESEWAEALASYERDEAEWRRNGGVAFTPTGPAYETAKCYVDAEEWCEFVGERGKWACVEAKWK